MRRILVTGGAGFIGSHLVDHLMEAGCEVRVFDNLSSGHLDNLSRWIGNPKFQFRSGDMLNTTDLADSLDGCQIVFHLAANPEVRIGYSNTRIDFEQNILATQNLLSALAGSEVCEKVIFTSTSTVYGEPAIIPTSEDYGPLRPISLYGSSKLACESLISGYAHMFGLKAVIVRLANIMGPRSEHGVVYDFARKLQENSRELAILGDGTQTKSYLHVYDCVRAFLTLVDYTQNREIEIFNVGSEDAVTVLEIAHAVAYELGLRKVEFRCDGGLDGGRGWKGDVKEMLLDTTKIHKLGWKATWKSLEAVRLVAHGLANSLLTA
jgi:UDP-glucose 4-epimerase